MESSVGDEVVDNKTTMAKGSRWNPIKLIIKKHRKLNKEKLIIDYPLLAQKIVELKKFEINLSKHKRSIKIEIMIYSIPIILILNSIIIENGCITSKQPKFFGKSTGHRYQSI